MQAERKSSTSTHIPDLDNANVGTDVSIITGSARAFPVFLSYREFLWDFLYHRE